MTIFKGVSLATKMVRFSSMKTIGKAISDSTLFHNNFRASHTKTPGKFFSDKEKKANSSDEFIDQCWDKFDDYEKKQFAILDPHPEDYPTRAGEIFFYQGLTNEARDWPHEAIDSYSNAIKHSSQLKLKLDAYDKLSTLFDKVGFPKEAAKARVEKNKLIAEDEISKKKRLTTLHPEKKPNALEPYWPHEESDHEDAV